MSHDVVYQTHTSYIQYPVFTVGEHVSRCELYGFLIQCSRFSMCAPRCPRFKFPQDASEVVDEMGTLPQFPYTRARTEQLHFHLFYKWSFCVRLCEKEAFFRLKKNCKPQL